MVEWISQNEMLKKILFGFSPCSRMTRINFWNMVLTHPYVVSASYCTNTEPEMYKSSKAFALLLKHSVRGAANISFPSRTTCISTSPFVPEWAIWNIVCTLGIKYHRWHSACLSRWSPIATPCDFPQERPTNFAWKTRQTKWWKHSPKTLLSNPEIHFREP